MRSAIRLFDILLRWLARWTTVDVRKSRTCSDRSVYSVLDDNLLTFRKIAMLEVQTEHKTKTKELKEACGLLVTS